jgi:hypothetical protein
VAKDILDKMEDAARYGPTPDGPTPQAQAQEDAAGEDAPGAKDGDPGDPNTGPDVTLRLLPDLTAPTAIRHLNRHLAFAMAWGTGQDDGSTYVRLTPDGPKRTRREKLQEALANRTVKVGEGAAAKEVAAATYWMRHRQRNTYDRVLYDPEGRLARREERVLNLWAGLARTPKRGNWSRIRRHLFEVICRRDPDAFAYLLQWLAHAVQYPGTSPGTVVVLKGAAEGSGKSTVGRLMAQLFGRHGAEFNTAEQLLGKFNGHLSTLSFIVVNEPPFAGDHPSNRKFRSMITDSEWVFEDKYTGTWRGPNLAHMLLTTNAERAVDAGNAARRFLVLEVDPFRVGDSAYFEALNAQAENGGLEALLWFLQHLDLSGFRPARDLPVTGALREQQLLSAPDHVQWALDLAERDGTVASLTGAPPVTFGQDCTTQTLHADYLAFCTQQRVPRPLALNAFGMWFGKLNLAPANLGPNNRRVRGWRLPDGATFRTAVETAAGVRK